MKTYRQKLSKWIEEEIKSSVNDEVVHALENVKTKIKEMEKEEIHMVNSTYEKGYNDGQSNKRRVVNYYTETYKTHDILKGMVRPFKRHSN
mgnify:CR=1 FL=1|jgi:phage shock protein A